jgi:hypothetical protein
MSKITIHNAETGETIERDMNDDELAQMNQDIEFALVLPPPLGE